MNATNKYREADISACGKYRYRLRRTWDEDRGKVIFVMLNPSTADGLVDDPTIRRCMGYANEWGYGSMEVYNLFAFRASRPLNALRQNDAVGEENDEYLTRMASEKEGKVVVAWGGLGNVRVNGRRADYVMNKILRHNIVWCIKRNKNGTPAHPLYLRKGLRPILYSHQVPW